MDMEEMRLALIAMRDEWLSCPGGDTDYSDGVSYGYEYAANDLDLFIMANFYPITPPEVK